MRMLTEGYQSALMFLTVSFRYFTANRIYNVKRLSCDFRNSCVGAIFGPTATGYNVYMHHLKNLVYIPGSPYPECLMEICETC